MKTDLLTSLQQAFDSWYAMPKIDTEIDDLMRKAAEVAFLKGASTAMDMELERRNLTNV